MRERWILGLLVIVVLAGSAPAPAQATDPSELLKTADEMIQTTSRIRDLQPKAPISRGVKTRAEISQYLEEQVRKNYDDARIREEGKLLRALGLIPASVDYRDLVLKLFTEQIAGFYDPEKKTFFIASWLPIAEQKPAMVHELGHALQDQYFDVEKIVKEARGQHNDDVELAHRAVLEGDATVVMLNYQLEPVKRTFSDLPDLSVAMGALMAAMQSQFPVFSGSPRYLQETVFFPYGYGAAFLQKFWLKNPSWKAVNEIYSDLPSSTEQIIHPEKYYGERDEPEPVNAELTAAKLGEDWKPTYKNVFGEFSLNLLLSLHLSEERSRRSAAGWDGDQVLLLENGAGKNAVLVETVWDSRDEADEFFAAMQAWFQQRFPNARKADEAAAGFSLVENNEIHSLRREGTRVRFVIGLPESDGPKLSGF